VNSWVVIDVNTGVAWAMGAVFIDKITAQSEALRLGSRHKISTLRAVSWEEYHRRAGYRLAGGGE